MIMLVMFVDPVFKLSLSWPITTPGLVVGILGRLYILMKNNKGEYYFIIFRKRRENDHKTY